MNIHKTVKIHPTAIVDKKVSIGKNSKIWHWVHICENAIIGESCSLGQNVFVGQNVKIRNNVKIQNNVSVYENVYLADNVFCGPSMVFTNVINPRSEIVRRNEYKKTIVEEGVSFGANSTIVCGVTIGKYAFIGAGALINKDVKPFALMVGNPAKQIAWMSRFGEKFILPDEGNKTWVCPKTKAKYVLKENKIYYYSK